MKNQTTNGNQLNGILPLNTVKTGPNINTNTPESPKKKKIPFLDRWRNEMTSVFKGSYAVKP